MFVSKGKLKICPPHNSKTSWQIRTKLGMDYFSPDISWFYKCGFNGIEGVGAVGVKSDCDFRYFLFSLFFVLFWLRYIPDSWTDVRYGWLKRRVSAQGTRFSRSHCTYSHTVDLTPKKPIFRPNFEQTKPTATFRLTDQTEEPIFVSKSSNDVILRQASTWRNWLAP